MTLLPSIVAKLTTFHGAWIVGSAANPDVDLNNIRDLDVIIPWSAWKNAVQLIPRTAIPNTFGGWKFRDEMKVIDVWPGELGELLVNGKSEFIWQPNFGIRYRLELR